MAEAAYTAKDITVLEGLEPVRLRPGMYIGSTGSRGLHHLVYEVVDNAVDEALAGRNDLVDVTIHPDNSVTVVDAGAGIPVDVIPEQGLPALTVVLTKLHAGGKFGGEGYKVSGGLHGVGVSVVNALSEWLVAEVRRDGKVYRQEFARGEPTADMEAVGVRGEGRVRHDDLVPPRPGGVRRDRVLRRDAVAASARDRVPHARAAHRPPRRARRRQDRGVPLRGRDPRLRRARERVEGPRAQARRLLRGRDRRRPGRGRDAVEQLVRRVGLLVREQHQHDRGRRAPLRLQGGAHGNAEPLRARQGPPQGEGGEPRGRGRPRGPRRGHLGEAPRTRSSRARRRRSSATRRSRGSSRPPSTSSSRSSSRRTRPRRARSSRRRSRPLARARLRARRASSRAGRARSSRTRFRASSPTARSRIPESAELFLVEGNSAGGSAVDARDRSFQAILPLRGKVINAEKNRINKVLSNEEIQAIITAIGTGIGEEFDAREAPLPPDHRHDRRRRRRRAHPHAHPHVPLPPDAGARRGRATSTSPFRRSTA